MNEALVLSSVDSMLQKIAWQVARDFNLCQEELYLEARLIALLAVRVYDPKKCKDIVAFIWSLVCQRLYRRAKFPGFREQYSRKSWVNINSDLPDRHHYSVERLLLEVSNDAQTAIRLVIRNQPTKTMAKQLLSDFGWTGKRIHKVFQEIQEALYL